MSDPSQRYLVKGFGLAPGQTLNVTGTYMTDGTSWLPLFFGLTSTPPPAAPLDGCGPKPGVRRAADAAQALAGARVSRRFARDAMPRIAASSAARREIPAGLVSSTVGSAERERSAPTMVASIAWLAA